MNIPFGPLAELRNERQFRSQIYFWIKCAIFLAFLTCWWSEMLMGMQIFFFPDVNPPQQSKALNNNRINALPNTYRVAELSTCKPPVTTGETRRREQADWSAPKVAVESTQELALGGYEKIAKGSGFIPQAGPIIMILSNVQLFNFSISGSVGEIGVHHGRFTSFLFVAARKQEDLVAADLFEHMQDFNVDLSGSGNKQKFLKGMQTYGLYETDLHTLFTGSTTDIPFDWSEQAGFAPFRLISVDAGHTAALTFNDLQIAFCNLLPGGIVILDDFFHGAWPGVTEGFFQLLHHRPEPLSNVPIYPFLTCKSKLFLTNNRLAYDMYYEGLLTHAPDLVRPFAHEKSRGSIKYELHGVPYLMCRNEVDLEVIHERWANLAF